MSYYDHATMMAHRIGPWAERSPTEVDKDIEHRAMLQQQLDPRGPTIRVAVHRMLGWLAQRRNAGSRRRAGLDRRTGTGAGPVTDYALPTPRWW